MKALNASQKAAIEKLEKLRVGALFMEPGTGKTRTAIELVESSQTDFVLWIVPFQTKQNLKDELNKWAFDKPYEIVGIESLGASDRIYMETLNKLKAHKKAFIVVDESLKIKNDIAKRTRRVLSFRKYSYYRLILNGTPISRNVLDLYAQISFLSPKILKMGYWEYRHKFCECKSESKNGYKIEYVSGYMNIDYLYSLIEPYVFDAKLNLSIGSGTQHIPYNVEDDSEYQRLKSELLMNIGDWGDHKILGTFQQMQQSYSLDEGKVSVLDVLMSKLRTEKVIIFVKFIKTREELQRRYPNALVMTYGKGSLGLNLQDYKIMIMYDKIWNYANLEQAERRIYRIGQNEDVNYYFMDGDIGLDNMMQFNIDTKGSMLKDFKRASKRHKKMKLKKVL